MKHNDAIYSYIYFLAVTFALSIFPEFSIYYKIHRIKLQLTLLLNKTKDINISVQSKSVLQNKGIYKKKRKLFYQHQNPIYQHILHI